MPSEQRLHPASILFGFAGSLKKFALPGLVAALSIGRTSAPGRPRFGDFQPPATFELWLMLLLIPSGLAALARYFSFRLRYDDTELVIRSGILFRNERHLPYHRIQNLEAVQNVFHRLLGVIEVRVETGAGKEPEATISVLPAAALAEMRRRVFEGRTQGGASPVTDAAPSPEHGQTLLRLPLRELLLCGFLENRGLVVIGALYGILWEIGLLGSLWERMFQNSSYGPGMVRGMMRTIAAGDRLPIGQIAVALTGLAVLLLLVRVISMGWAAVRLYGFHLSRVGEDLRNEFGLITRISTTIPLRRVQTMTIREGPLHRLVSRVSVRVATAGGGAQPGQNQRATEREWLAPIIHPRDLPALAREVLPGFDLTAVDWQRTHPRAFRRAVKPALVFAILVLVLPAAALVEWRAIATLPVAIIWGVIAARKHVQHLGWAATGDVVAFRSGWLWRSVTIARVTKVQVVRRIETPFDRRTAMGRVRIDTAGAGSHRLDIPYLPRETAVELHRRLAAAAASTAFRW